MDTGQGWAYPAVLQGSFFLYACSLQARGETLVLEEDAEAPAISAISMATVLQQQLPPEPHFTLDYLLAAGAALQALLEQPLPTCTPAAIFLAPYSPAVAALSPPSLLALLQASDFAALPSAVTSVLTACTAQYYASLPRAAFEAEVGAPSPRLAAKVQQWWAGSFSCPLLSWWGDKYGEAPSARAWATSYMAFVPSLKDALPPVQLGLDAESPAEEYWARGLDKDGQGPPPSHSALLALAFDRQVWMQHHHPFFMNAYQHWLDHTYLAVASPENIRYFALLLCGALLYRESQSSRAQQSHTIWLVTLLLMLHDQVSGQALGGKERIMRMRRDRRLEPSLLVAALEIYSDNAAVSALLCAMLQRMAVGYLREKFTACGAAAAVVQAMVADASDARLALHGCEALLELSRGGGCFSAAALSALVAILQAHTSNAIIAGAACAALLGLVYWEADFSAVAAEAVQALQGVLSLAPAGSKLAGCAAAALVALQKPQELFCGLVSASKDGTIRVWRKGLCERVLTGHTAGVNALAALPGGGLVSASDDSTLRLWEAGTGACTRVLSGHIHHVYSVCALAEGQLASAGTDASIRLWQADTGQCLGVLQGHTNRVQGLGALPGGRLASASWDGTLALWQAGSGEQQAVLEGHCYTVACVCALGEQHLVSGSWDFTLRVWRLDTGECTAVLEGHTDNVTCVCALGERHVVSGSRDATLRVWEAGGGCLRVLGGHCGSVNSACRLGEGFIVSAGSDKTLRVWEASTGVCVRVLVGHSEPATCVIEA